MCLFCFYKNTHSRSTQFLLASNTAKKLAYKSIFCNKQTMISNKNIFKITYPIFLTLIAQNIINVTDTAFLGRVSEIALGASAIAGVYYFAIFIIGFGFSQGAQILIGRRNGEKNYSAIGSIFNNGLIFISLMAVVLIALSYYANPYIMKMMVSSNDIYNASIEYLDWRVFGYLFAYINVMFRGFFVGITQTKVLTISAVITALVNVVLDYFLIFGHAGFPQMGIAGAALASVIAEAVTTIYLFYYSYKKVDIEKYKLFSIPKFDFKTIKQVLDISVFIMFQYFISIGTWFMFFLFIERIGERALAITNIGRSLYILLMIPGSAIATTVNTMVSNLIGAGRKDEVMKFVHRMVFIVIALVTPIMAITFFFPQMFASIYTENASLITESIPVLKVVSVAMIFCAFGSIIFNAVSGTGNTRTALVLEFVTLFFYIGYVFYTSVISPQPTHIIWMSEFVYWGIIGLFSYLYLRYGNWAKKVL